MGAMLRNPVSGARALVGIATTRWVFAGPRTVALAIADPCNTDCLMCWNHSPLMRGTEPQAADGSDPSPRGPQFMDSAVAERIVRESHALGAYRVVLCGDGEPTLHPAFDRILELITQLNMEPYVITNGLDVDDERAKFWATRRAHFRFSIHAGDEDTWLRVHPSGRAAQFERLSQVISGLVRARTPRVSTMHVIHKANFRDVASMVEHAHKLGVREIVFRPVRAEGTLAQVVLNPEEEMDLHSRLEGCLRLAEEYGIRTNLLDYLATNLHIHAGVLRTAHLYGRIRCYLGWLYAEFDLDGTMRPCLHSEITMGRAGEQAIRDMWHSPRYRDFRRQSITMPRRGELVTGCQCSQCVMVKYNINVHNLLHLKSLDYGAP